MSTVAIPLTDRRSLADRPIAWWLVATAALTFAMVVIGGITRLTLSGLSITEWNPVMGVLPPLGALQWQDAFDSYRRIPEYRQIHFGMSLAEFKGIYFWEYLHRLVGRLTGLVALLPPLAFLATGRIRLRQLPPLIAVPVLVLLQGVLGWYMVESGLSVRTSVSQYRLTAHLALALGLYGYCVWRAADLFRVRTAAAPPILRQAAAFVLGLACLTILAGGFTAGTKAGLVYNSFPLMDGRLVPAGYFAESPWWVNPFENVAAIQFDHRLLAELTAASAIVLWTLARRAGLAAALRWPVDLLLAAVVLQVALGISTLLLVVPVPLAAAHQSGAVLVLTAALLTLHGFRRAPV